ncbi:MAG: hypothetical protein ACE5JX_19125, partial [Acidobacteriota bacterium]
MPVSPERLFALGNQIGELFSGRARERAERERLLEAADIERAELTLKALKTQQRMRELELEQAPVRFAREQELAQQQNQDRRLSQLQQRFQNQFGLRELALREVDALEGTPGGAGAFHDVSVPPVDPFEQLGVGGLPGMELAVPTEETVIGRERDAALEQAFLDLQEFAAKEQIRSRLKPPIIQSTDRGVFAVNPGAVTFGEGQTSKLLVGSAPDVPKGAVQPEERTGALRIIAEIRQSLGQGKDRKYLSDFNLSAREREVITKIIAQDPDFSEIKKRRPREDTAESDREAAIRTAERLGLIRP